MHPPGPENGEARDLAGCSRLSENLPSNDADTVTDTQPACNSKIKSIASMPDDVGYFYDDDGKRQYEQCTMPPVEKVPLNREEAMLRTIAHACQWSQGEPVRWQAFLSCAGFDSRPLSEIAESLRVSPRLVQLRVAECKTWLAELRDELEARP